MKNQPEYSWEYIWQPEGNGFTLYRFVDGTRGRDCGRLNTDATVSTHNLAELYNSAPGLKSELAEAVEALRELLSCCVPTEMDTRTDRAMSVASKIVAKHQSS